MYRSYSTQLALRSILSYIVLNKIDFVKILYPFKKSLLIVKNFQNYFFYSENNFQM